MMDRKDFETCRILFQNKFEELVHLVGFIIRTYHGARSSVCQILIRCRLRGLELGVRQNGFTERFRFNKNMKQQVY
jgi:hypothetical protein